MVLWMKMKLKNIAKNLLILCKQNYTRNMALDQGKCQGCRMVWKNKKIQCLNITPQQLPRNLDKGKKQVNSVTKTTFQHGESSKEKSGMGVLNKSIQQPIDNSHEFSKEKMNDEE